MISASIVVYCDTKEVLIQKTDKRIKGFTIYCITIDFLVCLNIQFNFAYMNFVVERTDRHLSSQLLE